MQDQDQDLKDQLFEVVAETRMEANQNIRAKMIAHLSTNIESTANDPKAAYVLLTALKDSDSMDIKRLGLKATAKEINSREEVLSFLSELGRVVKENPYVNENYRPEGEGIRNRPQHFVENPTFTEGELSFDQAPTNYNDFMRSNNAIPNSSNDEDND